MQHEVKHIRLNGKLYEPYINDDGIYAPIAIGDKVYYQRIVPKYLFIEAYNKWIKGETVFFGQDDADDWSD